LESWQTPHSPFHSAAIEIHSIAPFSALSFAGSGHEMLVVEQTLA
jgi:hypothetical protein